MSGRVVTAAMEAEILRRWNENPSPSEIGRALGLARTTVQNVIIRSGRPLNQNVWSRGNGPSGADLTARNATHSSKMGKVLDHLAHAETNALNDEIADLREAVAAQNELIRRLLAGEITTRAGVPPVVQPCELRRRKCDSSENRRVLLISDLHAPYHHPDALDFLEALEAKYKFDRVINLGDELDFHAASFHTSEPGAHGAQRELELAREAMIRLHRTFPEADIVDSNHGSMAARKGKEGGLARHLITPYRDAIFGEDDGDGGLWRPGGRGDGWRWHPHLTIDLPNNVAPLYIAHGIAADPRNALRRMHVNIAQGHYHTEFSIRYEANPHTGMLFGISAGCLIDDTAVAFAYNKTTPARPAIGCAAIIEGVPMLLPMIRDKRNRWTGLVP